MSYRLHVRTEAVREFSAVAIWYEERKAGLGLRFLASLQDCYRDILSTPRGFQMRKDDFRHVMLVGFPYRVVYRVIGDDIYVFQVRHTSRKPSRRFGP